MDTDRRLLIAVPDPHFGQFVDEAMVDDLRRVYATVERLHAPDFGPDAWAETIFAFRPDAMLTGWDTPAIPPEAVPPLKCVAHTAGTVRDLVSRDMIGRGLLVTNWGGIAAASVAEHALLLILSALRRTTRATLDLHVERGWRSPPVLAATGLFGRRVGLHGFGAIARTLVGLLRPFGCVVSAYSEGVPDALFAEYAVTRVDSLEALFAESDVLVEVEALTPQNHGVVTRVLLDRLPDGAAFVNVGRGATVDTNALIDVAASGRIEIALDVFDDEPLPTDSPLRGLGNVTLTPHVGGPTIDRRRACGRRAIDTLKRFACGEPLSGVITPEIYDRST